MTERSHPDPRKIHFELFRGGALGASRLPCPPEGYSGKKRTEQSAVPRWDSVSKDKQRLLIQQQQPWTKSTGPRSRYGRLVSSRNALKKKRSSSQQSSEMSPDVTFVSHPYQEGDTDRPLEIGDRVTYVGGYQQTMLACGDSPLEVVGFCQLGTGAIACRTAGGKLIWVFSRDLERV